MNISYNWLKGLIDLDLSPEDTAAALTRVGLAVEGIHPHKDDFVFDIDLTSNRPDCLSHLGVGRELAAIIKAETRPVGSVSSSKDAAALGTSNLVTIEDPDLCNRFTARVIRGVNVGPSPQWLVDRLEAVGERSINNVADITNYVMLELGQPMHAFDLNKLDENRIAVRRAHPGEEITTLDEVDRKLEGSMLAICDAEKPVAIAGIMGGHDSSITNSTVNVLLEVAYFNRGNIRATSRRLNLATEASYRFERGVDIENLKRASDRAASLICELAGGELGEFVDVYPTRALQNSIQSGDISRSVKRLTGLDVPTDECIRILNALGIGNSGNTFISPTWRHDIAIEEDLVEEVARHAGYENIAEELPPAYGAGEYQHTEHLERGLRQALTGMGFDEAISYSFIDTRHDGVFEPVPAVIIPDAPEPYVTLQDSVIEGAVRMRSSALPGLLEAIRLNFNHQRRNIKLFELGKAFGTGIGENDLPNEQEIFAIAITGDEVEQNRSMAIRELGFYDAKGAIEAALDALGVTNAEFMPSEPSHLRRGQAASIVVGGEVIGSVGRLNDNISATYKFRQPVFLGELNLTRVLELSSPPRSYRPLAKYPGITRDVSFLVKRNVSYNAIRDAVSAQNFDLCRAISFVDLYEGKGLADDERSITIRLEYRSDERTLVEDEVEAIHKQIVAEICSRLGVRQRL